MRFALGLALVLIASSAGAAQRLSFGLSFTFPCDGNPSIGDFISVPVSARIRNIQIVAPPGARVTFYAGNGTDVKNRAKKTVVSYQSLDLGDGWIVIGPGDLAALEAACTAPPSQIEVRLAFSYETGP